MTTLAFNVNSTQITDKLASLDTKLRRKGMRRVGNEAAKILHPAMKSEVPVRLGWLKRSVAKKISVYASGTKVWAGAGPKAGFKILVARQRGKLSTIATLQYRGRKLASSRRRKGKSLEQATELIWPSKYAHLAGKGRKAVFVPRVLSRTASTVRSRMAQTFSEELGG